MFCKIRSKGLREYDLRFSALDLKLSLNLAYSFYKRILSSVEPNYRTVSSLTPTLINSIWPAGGRGGEIARTDFNLRELPCYLSNTYDTLPPLLKFIEEQDSGKFFVKYITCCHRNTFFDAMFSQILTFLKFFLLINNFFKTKFANSLSKSQEIDIFS